MFGKNTALLQAKVPEEVKEALERKARDLGYDSTAEMVREWAFQMAIGRHEYEKLLVERARGVFTLDAE